MTKLEPLKRKLKKPSWWSTANRWEETHPTVMHFWAGFAAGVGLFATLLILALCRLEHVPPSLPSVSIAAATGYLITRVAFPASHIPLFAVIEYAANLGIALTDVFAIKDQNETLQLHLDWWAAGVLILMVVLHTVVEYHERSPSPRNK